MLQGKRFSSNEEVIAETEAYFEAKDKSFYKHGIEKLEKRWNDCITLKVIILTNKNELCKTIVVILVSPGTY